jgi:uncharacterized protein (DUF885 family)
LVVQEQVIPVFLRLRASLAEQLPIAGDEVGLSRFPRGLKAYAKFLATATTTELTPKQINTIGLREVRRIESVMDQLLRQIGLSEGSVQGSCGGPESPASTARKLRIFDRCFWQRLLTLSETRRTARL